MQLSFDNSLYSTSTEGVVHFRFVVIYGNFNGDRWGRFGWSVEHWNLSDQNSLNAGGYILGKLVPFLFHGAHLEDQKKSKLQGKKINNGDAVRWY